MIRYLLLGFLVSPLAAQSPAARDSAVHILNRIAYGATPGLADSIARTGVMKWVDHQLGRKQPGDKNLASLEARFPALSSSSEELIRDFAAARRRQFMERSRGDSTPMRRPTPELRERRQALGGLQQATLLRAALSENQLGEVMSTRTMPASCSSYTRWASMEATPRRT